MTWATTLPTGQTYAYAAQVWSSSGTYRGSLGTTLTAPPITRALNSVGQPITIELPKKNPNNVTPQKGDKVKLYLAKGGGDVQFTGFVKVDPDQRDAAKATYQLVLDPVGTELSWTPFDSNYTSATDIGQMARDIVSACSDLSWTSASIPLFGASFLDIFDFTQYDCLAALDEVRRMGGVYFGWWVDDTGLVYVQQINVATATWTVPVQGKTSAITRTPSAEYLRNVVKGYGSVLPNTTTPISATYDQSAGSAYGKRVLTPYLHYPNLTDQTTLQNIVNNAGAAFNRVQQVVDLELPSWGQPIHPGDTLIYVDPSANVNPESYTGSGAQSSVFVVHTVVVDGPLQKVTVSDVAVDPNDLLHAMQQMTERWLNSGFKQILPITPGQITGGTTGGPSTPSTTAFATAQFLTGIERIAQANNAYVIPKWSVNPTNENVVRYDIRYAKASDGNWTTIPGPAGQVDGNGYGFVSILDLIPGQAYGFQIRAVNNAGVAGAWSATFSYTTAVDTTAPAVPAGLTAIKTPRGALVQWTPNTDADLQGYYLQVSLDGGTTWKDFQGTVSGQTFTFAATAAYTAPSGTAQGTNLEFRVSSVDWSANQSAWSAASSAVATDGNFFDELLAGNLKVFGTLTTGGLQTASSGARFAIDSVSIKAFDGTANAYGLSAAGQTLKIGSDGSIQIAGVIMAGGVQSGWFIGTAPSAYAPGASPPSAPSTGFMIDPTNGFRWYNAGTLVAQWAAAGGLTIYSGAAIYASTVASAQGLGPAGVAGWQLTSGSPAKLQFYQASPIIVGSLARIEWFAGSSGGNELLQAYIDGYGTGADNTNANMDLVAGAASIVINASSGITLASNAKGLTGDGFLKLPPSLGGAPAATSYGTVPIKIAESVVSVDGTTTVSFTSIPQVFRHLVLEWMGSTNGAQIGTSFDDVWIRFNSDQGADYRYTRIYSSEGGAVTVSTQTGNSAAMIGDQNYNHRAGYGRAQINNYADTTAIAKDVFSTATWGASSASVGTYNGTWQPATTAAVTRIDVITGSGSGFNASSLFTLWGIP